MRCDSGAPFLVLLGFNSRGSFATARHSDSRYVGPPLLPSRRFAPCPTKAWAASLRRVVGGALQRLRREISNGRTGCIGACAGGTRFVSIPLRQSPFEVPLDGTRTFDWRLTVQAGTIPRAVFRSLLCCLLWFPCETRQGSCEVRTLPVDVYRNTYISNFFFARHSVGTVLFAGISSLPATLSNPKFSCETLCPTQGWAA